MVRRMASSVSSCPHWAATPADCIMDRPRLTVFKKKMCIRDSQKEAGVGFQGLRPAGGRGESLGGKAAVQSFSHTLPQKAKIEPVAME